MMPASLPLQLAKIARNSTAPALTFFVEWGHKKGGIPTQAAHRLFFIWFICLPALSERGR